MLHYYLLSLLEKAGVVSWSNASKTLNEVRDVTVDCAFLLGSLEDVQSLACWAGFIFQISDAYIS